MIDVREITEDRVNKIWAETPKEITKNIPPLTILEIPNAKIIFIGLNPSLSDKDRAELQNKATRTLDFYTLDHKTGRNHKYFKKFHIISKQTGLTWGHFDLLFIRETKQDNIRKLFDTEAELQFVYKQLMVSKLVLNKLIDEDNPRIFVVNNTLSRSFLGKDRPENYDEEKEHWMDYRFKWHDDLGTYIYKNCPFFFTSMLTGQRALDNGSFERLVWHINFVHSKIQP